MSSFTHFKKAIELGNDNADVWYYLASAQWHDRDCDFVNTAMTFIERCTQDENCEHEKSEWAQQSADFSQDKGICPKHAAMSN